MKNIGTTWITGALIVGVVSSCGQNPHVLGPGGSSGTGGNTAAAPVGSIVPPGGLPPGSVVPPGALPPGSTVPPGSVPPDTGTDPGPVTGGPGPDPGPGASPVPKPYPKPDPKPMPSSSPASDGDLPPSCRALQNENNLKTTRAQDWAHNGMIEVEMTLSGGTLDHLPMVWAKQSRGWIPAQSLELMSAAEQRIRAYFETRDGALGEIKQVEVCAQ